MTEIKPNHLAGQNSTYLLQHSLNPVDWYPWSDEAWQIARHRNSLVVISIGYAACHWCHVMERESFEDHEVAAIMNDYYVSVKVDREERPDVDHVYMAAAYTSTGRGGWPLNIIALPDQRPVFAGTYFSKNDWIYFLNYFQRLYKNHPGDLDHQAAEISNGVRRQLMLPYTERPDIQQQGINHELFEKLRSDFDPENGGTRGAPKFPMPPYLELILRYGVIYNQAEALDYTSLTLEHLRTGGIYDHLGGGFFRYAVDANWHVPHFEKMLYDNAQLISLYSHACSLKGRKSWERLIEDTIGFIENELTSTEGLLYSSLDADSDGHEGAYYSWTAGEITRILGENADHFMQSFSCEADGNWENGKNVLRLNDQDTSIDSGEIHPALALLKAAREKRVRPATDTKFLTGWNALMISAYVDAYRALDKIRYLEKAMNLAAIYLDYREKHGKRLLRNIRPGNQEIPAYLDDYSLMIRAYLDLYQVTFDEIWLTAAKEMTGTVLLLFKRGDSPLFNLSSPEQSQLIVTPTETSDNVIPSSNAMMAYNMFIMGYISHDTQMLDHARLMTGVMFHRITSNPAFHSAWATVLMEMIHHPVEVTISGREPQKLLSGFMGRFLPGVIFSAQQIMPANPYRVTLSENEGNNIYVCRDKTCYPPVKTAEEALLLIREAG
jgi:uncharacterized protein YyaL (SSP411 family)